MDVNAQIPLPSFDDLRKILQFWFDQEDKWFYFETENIQGGTIGESDVPNPMRTHTQSSLAKSKEINQFIQTRVVGKINDVVPYPPSLYLQEVSVFTVHIAYNYL